MVADVNDGAPTFSRDIYTAVHIQNNDVDAALLVVTANDVDNARLTCSSHGPHGTVGPLPTAGEITTVTSFDREVTSTACFLVTAHDAGNPSQSGFATVVVSVVDVNDN